MGFGATGLVDGWWRGDMVGWLVCCSRVKTLLAILFVGAYYQPRPPRAVDEHVVVLSMP